MFRTVAKEELRVPGQVEYLGELRNFVTRVGKKYGFSERIISAFKLSIDEAATNIIKHAYRDWEGDVTLRIMAKRNSLTMVLIDQGKYFDPRQVNSPDLQRYVEIGKRGGLGIFIMRRLLDEIDYRKTEEGNELWMTKNRDEEKKKKVSFTSIPLSLKMRYWLYSLAIFTLILIGIFVYNRINNRQSAFNYYITQAQLACQSIENQATQYWNSPVVDAQSYERFKIDGTKQEIGINDGAQLAINDIRDDKEYQKIISEVLMTSNQNLVIATSDTTKEFQIFMEDLRVSIPEDLKPFREYDDSKAYIVNDENGTKVLDVVWPIYHQSADDQLVKLADTHFRIDYKLIERRIARSNRGLIGELLFVWAIVSAGLFLLIYVVMNPFKRLQDWVKKLSEPGVAEEVDIDSSTEIGAIAQAFSDVTEQLRKSQVDLAEQERLQQEMHIAKQIQQTLLPDEFPELEGYDLSSFYAAAKDVGGDFFDFVEVDKDTLGVAVADVSGKGVPGAFVMTMIRTALRSEARGVKDAAEVLAKVNEFVVNDMKKGMFVTLFYVIIDSKRRRLNFASAGHNPMVLHRPSKNKTYYLNPRGFPIGISLPDNELFRKSIQSDTIALAEDDILLVYTDGVTEAMNAKRRLYGDERFLRLVRECGRQSAGEFVDSLKKDLNTFTEGNEQNDDITLVAIKEKMSVERVEYDRAVRAYHAIQEGVGIKEACRDAGISTYSYYQKFKEKFDTEGVGIFSSSEDADQIESKHLSIEEKNKIFDIIRRFPEYGAKRIAEELNTERYEFAVLPVSRIYEELVRSRLNTKQLREAFVERGGKKKRIKPPGTPMMRLDGEIIMNREQYLEPEDDEDEDEIEPDVKDEKPKTDDAAVVVDEKSQEADDTVQERSTPNVFAMDKETLMTAPLEDIFEKQSTDDDESEADTGDQGETAEAEEPAFEADSFEEENEKAFSFVDDDQNDDTEDETTFTEFDDADEPAEKMTVVSEEKLKEFEDEDISASDELSQIEDNIYPEEDGFELLSNYDNDDEHDDFGLDFSFEDDSDESEFENSDTENIAESQNDDEIFDLDIELDDDDDDFEFSEEQEPSQEPSNKDQDEYDDDDEIEEFKELLIDDDKLFELWATDSSEKSSNNGSNGKNGAPNTELFLDDYQFDDPFEEFLEIEDEHGLIGEDGDIDRSISEQLLKSDNVFVDADDDNNNGHDNVFVDSEDDDEFDFDNELIGYEEESYDHHFQDNEDDDNVSLDQLVTLSSDEDEFFAQHDEDFDRLIQAAISNDGAAKSFLSSNNDSNRDQNDLIETELKNAMVLYSESNFDAAIAKLNSLAERFPNDFRAHSLLGNAYFREKKFKEASNEYERVIDLDPKNEKACENLAIAYAKQGELEKAIHHWERLLHITPDRMDVRLSIQRAKAFLENY